MTTPTELYLRRILIGIDRESLARRLGIKSDGIRNAERGTRFSVFKSHIAELERYEAWSDTAFALVEQMIGDARQYPIGERPVVWIFDEKSFAAFCPNRADFLDEPFLHALCAAQAFDALRIEGEEPIAAELLHAQYTEFLSRHDMRDGGVERCKWFRAWSQKFVTK